ncbi:MAG: heme/copper-type cytochrome/quinol oxidase subunit 1 [Candidatus Paceibacteria bacterium]|jgi:heme/copper-type cytochrome/quinol oxidase subunit 1
MPPLARRYLKTAFAFGILGVLTGMHMSSALHLQLGSMHRWYLSAHTHIMLVGFAMLAANSLALCLLPEAPGGSRHRPGLDKLAYWLITLCTLGRFSFEAAIGYMSPEPGWMHQTINAVATLQGLGLIVFWVNQWPRINGHNVSEPPA